MTSIEALVRDLVAAAPALDAVLAEHMADQRGELLPHLFVADVTRWPTAGAPDSAVLAVVERHLGEGDAAVRDVIALSFVENLEPDDRAVREALGPRLRAELAVQEQWRAGRPPAT